MKRIDLLAKKLWRIGYRAACKADPNTFRGAWTWDKELAIPGRKAAWLALARYWIKHQSFPCRNRSLGAANSKQTRSQRAGSLAS